jgi:hypothetical protein
MRLKILIAACFMLARPALAQNAPYLVPCASISAAAVTAVPAPFDRFMRLVCYNSSGQALLPVDGFDWVQGKNALGLASMDDRPGPNGQPRFGITWYVSLTPRDISAGDDAALRRVLLQEIKPEFINRSRIIEMDAETSAGELKQEFIISPADPAATHGIKLLLECHVFCQGSDTPWLLAIVASRRQG